MRTADLFVGVSRLPRTSAARCSPRANASASRSSLFSASRCLIRVAATSRRRSSESLDARCRLGIAVVVVEGGCRCRSRWTSARRSPWLYSHERETWASRATVSNVIGAPAFSMRRSAVTARLRVEARGGGLRRLPGGSCQAVTLVSSSCSLVSISPIMRSRLVRTCWFISSMRECPLDLETSIRVSVR